MRKAREQMIHDIEMEVRYTRAYIGKDAFDERVMRAMAEVPRHKFVPPDMEFYAYDNRPLSIGNGQTISQPYIVALMTDLLEPQAHHIVLDIGTGCGYQAAILSRLVKQVYSVEIIPALGEQSRERLHRLGYDNIEIRIGDGYFGWPEHAPYDGIVVAATTPTIPPELTAQLKPGGKLVLPVGREFMAQELMVVEKDTDSNLATRDVLPVAFVPLTGKH
jgi:protein-L-isoaspartate(D-aspartate) O-methyltransferase